MADLGSIAYYDPADDHGDFLPLDLYLPLFWGSGPDQTITLIGQVIP